MDHLRYRSSIVVLAVLGLCGCGGTKVLKEPKPMPVVPSLATASDSALSANLDWVIFRDGPGSWARNVDWDEYLMSIRNVSDNSLQITSIVVVDSLGARVETRQRRKELVKASKATKRRYKGEGLTVKAGLSGSALLGASAVAVAGTTGLGGAAMAGGAAAAGAAAVVVLVPALAVGGVVRGVNNSEVDKQIRSRQTTLPVTLEAKENENLVQFFPLTPSPQRIELSYVNRGIKHTLIIDTKAALNGMHLTSSED